MNRHRKNREKLDRARTDTGRLLRGKLVPEKVSLEPEHVEWLEEIAERTGLSKAEVCRRILTKFSKDYRDGKFKRTFN